MILNCFDSPASKVYFDYNKDAFFYNLLLADAVVVSVNTEWADVVLGDIDSWSDEKMYSTFKKVYRNCEVGKESVRRFKELSLQVKRFRALNCSNKEFFKIISRQKMLIKNFKCNLQQSREDFINFNHVKDMMPFINDGIWRVIPIDYDQKENKEDGLINPIVNAICESENILTLNYKFVEILSSTTLDSSENKDNDFIKIPLWDFPPFMDITYQQIKYTRDNLQPGLLKFKSQLTTLKDQLSKITFSTENFQQIKQLYNELLNTQKEPVQKLIDESLYISQMKNNYKENTGYQFCLGIATAETMLNTFEKTETILPYVAGEIKNRIEKQFDLKSSCVFTFLENLSPVEST